MPILPYKRREAMNLLRSPKGAVVFEAKAHPSSPGRVMLSVYVFTPNRDGYKGTRRRFYVLREYLHDFELPDRASRNKALQNLCDLAAMQLGGCEYVLKQALK